MKLAFSTLGCPDWGWRDIVSTAKDLGFEGVELRGVQQETHVPRIRELRPAHIEITRAQLARIGLAVPCITAGCSFAVTRDRDWILQYIDTAAALGVPYVRVLGDDVIAPGHDVDDGLVCDNALAVADAAREKGVTLLIETNGAYASSARLRALLERIGSPAVAALWDIHHPFRFFHEPPKDTVDTLGPYIKHVHCKDSVMQGGKVRYRIMGQGDVPTHNAVICLSDIGYDGFYSLEWVKRWDLTLEEPGIAFAQFLRYMRG